MMFNFSLSKDTVSLKSTELLGVLWMLHSIYVCPLLLKVKQIHPFRDFGYAWHENKFCGVKAEKELNRPVMNS